MGSVVAGVVIKVGGVMVLVFKTPALGSSVYVLLYFPPVAVSASLNIAFCHLSRFLFRRIATPSGIALVFSETRRNQNRITSKYISSTKQKC